MSRGKWKKYDTPVSDVSEVVECVPQECEEDKERDEGGLVRSWTFILYPDSAPEGWRDILDDMHIGWAESPLHDKDLNADATPKKPHWHILLAFPQKKSYNQVCVICRALNAPIPQRIHDMRGMVRYMAHLDNPEKYQYSVNDIKGHQGFDVADFLRPSATVRYECIRDMMIYCVQKEIFDFDVLLLTAMTEHFDDWFPLLCDNSAYVMQSFLRSRFLHSRPTGEIKIDIEEDEENEKNKNSEEV